MCFVPPFSPNLYLNQAELRMEHISIVVYEDVLPTALSSTISLLTSANEAALARGRKVAFEIELIGVHLKNIQLSKQMQCYCTKTIADKFDTDVIILPPMNTGAVDPTVHLLQNSTLVSWIKEKYRQKAQIISLCSGAYILAETGLLNGMPATSHWNAIEDLQLRYPSINFTPAEVVTNSKSIITGGGGFSALNALLYFIEKQFGKEIAVELSKIYGLEYARTSQSLFAVFSGQQRHNDNDIHKAQAYIESKFKTDISVEQVATRVNMSKRNFIRRFKSATSMTPIEFIQRIKVEAAKKALEAGEMNIESVTYAVGYNDLKTFRSVFKKITGLTPVAYRNKYNV